MPDVLSVVQHRDTSSPHDGAPPSVSVVVQKYHGNGNKLGVPEMRKWMKILVAELFYPDKYSADHKCRGIWRQKPSNWDQNVPFCDPNNAENPRENSKKPGKNTLAKMMKYLVAEYDKNFPQMPVEELPKEEPVQMTETGQPLAQCSDWQIQAKLQMIEGDYPQPQQENISIPPMQFHHHPRAPIMESGEYAQSARVQEELMFEMPHNDLVGYILDPSNGPLPDTQLYEEVGGAATTEAYINVQTSQNDVTTVASPFVQQAQPVYSQMGPVASPALPPPSNQMDGQMTSDGHMGSAYSSMYAVSGGNDDDAVELFTELFNGQTFQEIDPSEFQDLNLPVMETTNPTVPVSEWPGSQTMMGNSSQVSMEGSQPMMNTVEPCQMSQPVMETTAAAASGQIPVMVMDFTADDEMETE